LYRDQRGGSYTAILQWPQGRGQRQAIQAGPTQHVRQVHRDSDQDRRPAIRPQAAAQGTGQQHPTGVQAERQTEATAPKHVLRHTH
jgi:hypothetical protein